MKKKKKRILTLTNLQCYKMSLYFGPAMSTCSPFDPNKNRTIILSCIEHGRVYLLSTLNSNYRYVPKYIYIVRKQLYLLFSSSHYLTLK